MNVSCLHLYKFCATGVISGLATTVVFTKVSWRGWECILHGAGPAFGLIFVPWNSVFLWLCFKVYILYEREEET
jgi:hypothetical protein